MRLRFMVMPLVSCRYAASRSSVQAAKGRPSVRGAVSAVAITVATCSAV